MCVCEHSFLEFFLFYVMYMRMCACVIMNEMRIRVDEWEVEVDSTYTDGEKWGSVAWLASYFR